MLKAMTALLIFAVTFTTSSAVAHHDAIYTPCDTTTGHVHMTFEEVSARISIMEQDGTIPAGMISRYNEERDGGKGNEDPRFVWARHLEEGQILSLGNWASGEHPELEQLMFSSGLVAEWQLDANKRVRRFDDPYWMQENPLSPSFTVWQSLCMANLGYSIPMFEVNDDGQWVSNIPSTTTTSPPVTTTTEDPTFDGGTSIHIDDPNLIPVITTTTTSFAVGASTSEEPATSVPTSNPLPQLQPVLAEDWTSRYFDAEWGNFPFEQTVLLLEERYPPTTSNKYHFRLSVAVDYLRAGGKIRGLDNVWNSGLPLP